MKPNHIVFTTIYVPNVLYDLQSNIAKFGHLDDTICWVVGDKKTPAECIDVCEKITSLGLEVRYLDIEIQDEWGKRFPELYKKIPYNNESRRNIGYLFALENGCERMISIDDDNYPKQDDFIGGHLNTGKQWKNQVVMDTSGYYNICEHLDVLLDRQIYPRGFPFELRGKKNTSTQKDIDKISYIGVTEGLWLKDPDVDATTWLNGKVEVKAYQGPANLVLDQDTWSPINTQNTSVVRDLIPAFLCIPMGYKVPGGNVARYGDIWGGYFLQALMAGSRYYVNFGEPVVEHRRNPHNYLDDLRYEFWGMMLTDWMLVQLRKNFFPTSTGIVDRLCELSEFLQFAANHSLPNWCPLEVKGFVDETAIVINLWANVCDELI